MEWMWCTMGGTGCLLAGVHQGLQRALLDASYLRSTADHLQQSPASNRLSMMPAEEPSRNTAKGTEWPLGDRTAHP